MSLVSTPTRPVSVEELRRGWVAVQDGEFRRRTAPGARTAGPAHSAGDAVGHSTSDSTGVWAPAMGERVLPVLGCAGSVGTTTVALAVSLAADVPVRVVECCSVTVSGLAAASHAELGLHASGWRQGWREQALLERVNDVLGHPTDIPTPSLAPGADGDGLLTVLDVGWDLRQLLADPSWLSEAVRASPTVIAVASATVPGLRRLEGALELLGADRTVAALMGPRLRKWPKAVAHSAGPRTRHLLEQGRFQAIPQDRGLAVAGLDSTPLPPRLLQAAGGLLAQTDGGAATDSTTTDHSGRKPSP